MRSRIVFAIVGVAALTLVVLGVPLAVVAQRFYVGRSVVELQRRAALAVGEVTLPLDAAVLRRALTEPDDPADVTVYDDAGQRLVGPGPDRADFVTQRAVAGQPASALDTNELVVASPISDRDTERVVGAVRVTTPSDVVRAAVWRAWALMTLAAAVALIGAWVIARTQARRLSAPVERLRERAALVGSGAVPAAPRPSGIDELDEVERVLTDSATKLSEVLARERAFSSDVSHQLRTPLTRLSILLEQARATEPDSVVLVRIDEEVTTMHGVVEHLLALGRDREPASTSTDPSAVLGDLATRWAPVAERHARRLETECGPNLDAVSTSPAALGQVLDVLVDNAFTHGTGRVRVAARRTVAAVVFEVSDEGPGIADERSAAVFSRRSTSGASHHGSGIGLALARSIIEADDGRLLLVANDPPLFHIVVRLASR